MSVYSFLFELLSIVLFVSHLILENEDVVAYNILRISFIESIANSLRLKEFPIANTKGNTITIEINAGFKL